MALAGTAATKRPLDLHPVPGASQHEDDEDLMMQQVGGAGAIVHHTCFYLGEGALRFVKSPFNHE